MGMVVFALVSFERRLISETFLAFWTRVWINRRQVSFEGLLVAVKVVTLRTWTLLDKLLVLDQREHCVQVASRLMEAIGNKKGTHE